MVAHVRFVSISGPAIEINWWPFQRLPLVSRSFCANELRIAAAAAALRRAAAAAAVLLDVVAADAGRAAAN